jgi:uncharacterized membrane protein YgcG
MRLFSKKRGPLVHAKSPGELLLRSVGLIAVFALVAWLFSKNMQANIDRLAAQSSLQDKAQALSQERRAIVREYAKRFKEQFGYELRVAIGPDSPQPPRDAKTVLLSLDPAARRAALLLPPLAARGLGPDLLASLGDEHFAPYFERDDWQEGLLHCLERLWLGLNDVTHAKDANHVPRATQ